MALRPRLLPCVILAASALLGIKLVALCTGSDAAAITAAWAETKTAAASPAAETAASATKPPAAPAPSAPAEAAPAPGKPAEKPYDPMQMSAEEIAELQQLAQRRTELDKRAAELREREVLMQAAEKRIDEKIARLQALEKSIQGVVKTQDDQENTRLQSLAHMYEQMKPMEAARILDQLDVPVVLTMLSRMREQKAAPILATMDPAKAKAVTLALTEQRNPRPAPEPAPKQAE